MVDSPVYKKQRRNARNLILVTVLRFFKGLAVYKTTNSAYL